MTVEALFSPLELGKLQLPNRFVMAPMTRSRSPDGVPGRDVASYYKKRAQGEVGLIITEGVGIPHPASIGYSGVDVLQIPHLFGEDALAGWKHVVDEVHAAGGRIAPQLWHQGALRQPGTGQFPLADSMRPSGKWGPLGRHTSLPRDYVRAVSNDTQPMTDEDIADVISAYGVAARNARDLGFDAIAIHGAHGYLLDTFLWAETNQRTDSWGGAIAERARFPAAVVQEIRKQVGTGMPIFFRYSQWKQQDFEAVLARNPNELEAMLGPIADAGVDVFDVSERNFDLPAFSGSSLSLAGWTRKLTGSRSMAVGSVGLSRGFFETASEHEDKDNDMPRLNVGAERIDNLPSLVRRFESGEFDLVGVGRMMIAHADWVRRVRVGDEIGSYHRSILATLN